MALETDLHGNFYDGCTVVKKKCGRNYSLPIYFPPKPARKRSKSPSFLNILGKRIAF